MWVITTAGFFSIVQKPGDTDLTVRARVRADLDALRAIVPTLADTVEGGGTDYPYRARVSHAALAQGMAVLVSGIDYTNFKDEVFCQQGERRERIYRRVWAHLGDLKDLGE